MKELIRTLYKTGDRSAYVKVLRAYRKVKQKNTPIVAYGVCPICNKPVTNTNYCPHCGQRILYKEVINNE